MPLYYIVVKTYYLNRQPMFVKYLIVAHYFDGESIFSLYAWIIVVKSLSDTNLVSE